LEVALLVLVVVVVVEAILTAAVFKRVGCVGISRRVEPEGLGVMLTTAAEAANTFWRLAATAVAADFLFDPRLVKLLSLESSSLSLPSLLSLEETSGGSRGVDVSSASGKNWTLNLLMRSA
jgi:hypothetical protein